MNKSKYVNLEDQSGRPNGRRLSIQFCGIFLFKYDTIELKECAGDPSCWKI